MVKCREINFGVNGNTLDLNFGGLKYFCFLWKMKASKGQNVKFINSFIQQIGPNYFMLWTFFLNPTTKENVFALLTELSIIVGREGKEISHVL